MTFLLAIRRAMSPTTRATIRMAAGAALAVGAAFVVWVLGLDVYWACALVLAVGSVSALLATLRFEDDPPFDTPVRDTPRGARLTIAALEDALASCDRLARPAAVRRWRALLIAERDDHLARATIVRRMRALLIAELQHRGLAFDVNAEINADISADIDTNSAITALFGSDARVILQPHDSTPVTSAAIARCLDVIERFATTTSGLR